MSTIPGPQVQGDGVAPAGGLGAGSPVLSRPRPTPQPRIELCPYCGRESVNTTRCSTCGGHFDALSKQATQNAMGPWWLRDGEKPIRPGCSYDTIRQMVAKGSITLEAVLRGPTTRQFWMRARRVPGVAHLLGVCHSCQREASPESFMCAACGASFNTETDRQHLGLSPVSLLPGQAGAERIAAVSVASVPIAMGQAVAARAPARESAGGWAPAPSDTPRANTGWEGGTPPLDVAAPVDVSPSAGGRRRGRISLAGAAGLMLLGAIMASGAAWVALVRAQGGVEGALVAIGAREPAGKPVGTDAETVIADGGTGRRESDATPAEGSVGPAESGRAEATLTPTGGESRGGVSTVTQGGSTGVIAAPDAPTNVVALRERLADALAEGDWEGVSAVVGEMERAGAMDADLASHWRMAVTARVEREGLAGMP